MVMSLALRSLIFQTRVATGSDRTVGEQFLATSEHIKQIDSAGELSGINGALDGIFAYNDHVDSVSFVMVQDLTELPAQAIAFDSMTYAFGTVGGIRMDNVGSNVLAYAEV
jgi:hypothetical protein